MATIIDVSKMAGVSKTLVSRVINNQAGVSAESKEKILQAMYALNYRPNRLAQSLVRQKTLTIGVVLDNLCDPYFFELISGIDAAIEQSDYHVIYCHGHNNAALKDQYINFFSGGITDGVVLYGSNLSDTELIYKRIQSDFPMVIVEHEVREGQANNIIVNNEYGSQLAVNHLWEKGCRRIAHVTGSMTVQVSQYRLNGYLTTIQKYSAEPIVFSSGEFSVDAGYSAVMSLFKESQSQKPDGIYFGADINAFGGLLALQDLGIQVPQDVKVVGFDDDKPYSYNLGPLLPLTTIRQPLHEIGSQAVNLLLQHIDNPSLSKQQLRIDPILIQRETT